MREVVLLFPGQGSQFVGMGKNFAACDAAARETFEKIEDALGFALTRTMFEGSESALQETRIAQPAIMAASAACFALLCKMFPEIKANTIFVAGHSLGEYSACFAADVFSLASTAKLLEVRGRAMQEAVPMGASGMVALLGGEIAAAQELCAQILEEIGGVCEVANDNSNEQTVVSGTLPCLEALQSRSKEFGFKRAIPLSVSAGFHSSLMRPAAQQMKEALANTSSQDATIPVIANVTATPLQDDASLKEGLVAQITSPVRWRETMDFLLLHKDALFLEVGASQVLTGLLKKAFARAMPDHMPSILALHDTAQISLVEKVLLNTNANVG